MATKTTTKSAPKSKLVNGQRINIATGEKMQSSVARDQSTPSGKTVTLKSGQVLTGKEAEAYGGAPVTPETPEVVDATQPSPTGAQIMPPIQESALAETNAFERAQGLPITPMSQAITQQKGAQDIASKYRAGVQTAQASGVPSPVSTGAGQAGVQQFMPQQGQEPDYSSVNTLLQEDEGWNQLTQMKKEYFDPKNQKDSLVSQYKKLYKQSGLDELDEEIIDAKSIIEGTEDDIRNEVQMAGGFGTDSQIQALASSRNKVLLKNYNNLVAMREMKQQNFDTMLTLADKDRQYADQQFDRMMNFDMQILNYKQKFVDNTRDQYQKIADKLGYQALYESLSKDPRQLGFAERILGVGAGGLANLAAQPDLERQLLQERISTERAQRSNIYSQISERQAAKDTKPLSAEAAKVVGIANTLIPELETLKQRFKSDFRGTITKIKTGTDPELVKLVENAADKVGRLRSGGAVNPDEEKRFKNQLVSNMDYFFGSSDKTGKAIDGIITEAQTVVSGVEGGIESALSTKSPSTPLVLAPTKVPEGYYQASDGLLYKR